MSLDVKTKSGKDFFFFSPDDFLSRYQKLLYSIETDQVVYFSVGDGNGCLDYFVDNTLNVPRVTNTKRLVYFGDLAHFLVYNLALSLDCPKH